VVDVLSWAVQWYHSQVDLIWPDSTFKRSNIRSEAIERKNLKKEKIWFQLKTKKSEKWKWKQRLELEKKNGRRKENRNRTEGQEKKER
jgi:hypothetical protein